MMLHSIHEVGGIGGDFQVFLPPKKEITWIELKQGLPVQFTVVYWKHTGELGQGGAITKIAHKMVEIHSEILPSSLANLRICLYDPCDHEITDDLYGKEVAYLSESPLPCWSISPPYPRKPRLFCQSSWAPFYNAHPIRFPDSVDFVL
jgi:hypothetical protein